MATFKQLRTEAEKHNAELVIDRVFGRAEAWLPESEQWDSTMASCIVVDYGYIGSGVMSLIYDDLIQDMSAGSYWKGE